MKTILSVLVLHLCWTSSTAQNCGIVVTSDQCVNVTDIEVELMYKIQNLSRKRKTELTVTCISKEEGNIFSDMEVDISCSVSEPTTNTMRTMQSNDNRCQAANSGTITGLGAVMGILVVLLAVVTAGWMWTCWMIKKQGRITISSHDIGNNDPALVSNPSYHNGDNQLTLQNCQLPIPTPTYETIPPISNTMDGIKLDLEDSEGGHGVSTNQEAAFHDQSCAQIDSKEKQSTEQTHMTRKTKGYEGLEESSELLESVLMKEDKWSESRTAVTKSLSKKETTTNSSAKSDDKKREKTTAEHDQYQTENDGDNQQTPKKRPAPSDYEVAVPTKISPSSGKP